MTLKQNIKYWPPVIIWMGFIFWMSTGAFSSENTASVLEPLLRSLLPGISSHGIDFLHGIIRKCAHITEYFILGLLLFRAFHRRLTGAGICRSAFSSMIAVVLYAASDEFHQSFEAARTASITDVGFDSIGGMIAQAVCVLWHWKRVKTAS